MNDERRGKLLLAVRSGTDLETSCHYAELSVAEVYRRLEIGKRVADLDDPAKLTDEQAECLALWRDLAAARAEAVVRNIASIQQAAQGGAWQAAAWWLERSMPETYSKKHAEARPAVPGSPARKQIDHE